MSMGQRQELLRKPTLFQHFGVTSSFDTTRDNNLKDRYRTIVVVVIGIIWVARCCSV